jgi:hypothetical protein
VRAVVALAVLLVVAEPVVVAQAVVAPAAG